MNHPTSRCLTLDRLTRLAGITGIACALLLGQHSVGAATTTVHVFNFDFSVNPQGQPIVDPIINLGDTIHWVWDAGGFPHSTTSAAGQAESWNSGVLPAGSIFDHTFNNLGIFNYYCIPHGADLGGGQVSGMSGSITVVPEPATWALWLLGTATVGVVLRRRHVSREAGPKR